MFDHVDPFIGTDVTDLPVPSGLAATWWSPKPQVGNTHPGATYPFGMVSACAYSGAYPTGYGCYDLSTEGLPPVLHDELVASGFTHFQQSGTGAIRKYYNYFRVTPMLEPLDGLGTSWELLDELAEPGYYAATLSSGIRCELTVGARTAVHRYTFPEHPDSRIVIDLSLGGLAIPYGATVPLRAHLETIEPGVAQAEVVVEGAPLAVHMECDFRAPIRFGEMLRVAFTVPAVGRTSVDLVSTSPNRRSFQIHVNWMRTSRMSGALASGIMIDQKVRHDEAPSSAAASWICQGTVRKKPRMTKVQNGMQIAI